MSRSPHWSKYLRSPFRTFGMRHMSKASSITRMPMRSQASSSSGDGGLWLVRMALTPMPSEFPFGAPWRGDSRPRRARPGRE